MEAIEILLKTEKYIRDLFNKEGSGHDWWHIHRVRETAVKIGKEENANLFQIELAALLHDLDDWKINGSTYKENERVKHWFEKIELDEDQQTQIIEIIQQVSYKGAGVKNHAKTIEAMVVQDADRLDAIGAIGIARTFAYGGNKNRLIFDPEVNPTMHQSFEEYQMDNGHTINHFYEKLLLLKDRMNTKTGKQLAIARHEFMENYLTQFFNEWELNT
ncbi:HD domain-containing protein [Sunxiuqinia sp. A32]|uniref:HD domain-containing protein n=1 Tax=Sunxiuqinia sp. A32 TaxID=3461496 RepID=UPI00404614FF